MTCALTPPCPACLAAENLELRAEIDRLRAELAKVTAERDRNAGIALRETATANYYRERDRQAR